MTRPLIDFVHIDTLPWEEYVIPNASLPTRRKLLSVDPDTGAKTILVELPAAWERVQSCFYDVDEEVMVLSGEIETGHERLTQLSYVFRPAGQRRGNSLTRQGATLLAFLSAQPRVTPSESHGPMYDGSRAIGPISVAELDWDPPRVSQLQVGAGMKTLRWDESAGEGILIFGALPFWKSPLRRSLGHAEETYVIEGEMETPKGVMTPGAYWALPSGTVQGPMRSRPGCLMLVRFKGTYGHLDEFVPGLSVDTDLNLGTKR